MDSSQFIIILSLNVLGISMIVSTYILFEIRHDSEMSIIKVLSFIPLLTLILPFLLILLLLWRVSARLNIWDIPEKWNYNIKDDSLERFNKYLSTNTYRVPSEAIEKAREVFAMTKELSKHNNRDITPILELLHLMKLHNSYRLGYVINRTGPRSEYCSFRIAEKLNGELQSDDFVFHGIGNIFSKIDIPDTHEALWQVFVLEHARNFLPNHCDSIKIINKYVFCEKDFFEIDFFKRNDVKPKDDFTPIIVKDEERNSYYIKYYFLSVSGDMCEHILRYRIMKDKSIKTSLVKLDKIDYYSYA